MQDCEGRSLRRAPFSLLASLTGTNGIESAARAWHRPSTYQLRPHRHTPGGGCQCWQHAVRAKRGPNNVSRQILARKYLADEAFADLLKKRKQPRTWTRV